MYNVKMYVVSTEGSNVSLLFAPDQNGFSCTVYQCNSVVIPTPMRHPKKKDVVRINSLLFERIRTPIMSKIIEYPIMSKNATVVMNHMNADAFENFGDDEIILYTLGLSSIAPTMIPKV